MFLCGKLISIQRFFENYFITLKIKQNSSFFEPLQIPNTFFAQSFEIHTFDHQRLTNTAPGKHFYIRRWPD